MRISIYHDKILYFQFTRKYFNLPRQESIFSIYPWLMLSIPIYLEDFNLPRQDSIFSIYPWIMLGISIYPWLIFSISIYPQQILLANKVQCLHFIFDTRHELFPPFTSETSYVESKLKYRYWTVVGWHVDFFDREIVSNNIIKLS